MRRKKIPVTIFNTSPSHKGIFYAVFSGLLYGCIGYFGVGLIDEGFSVSAMLFWRFLGASLCFIPFLLPRLKMIDMNHNQILLALINGIVAFGGTSLFFFFASEYIGTGLAMVVFFAYPAIVAIANWGFHGHRFTLLYAISFAILFLGLFLLVDLHEVTLDIVGILLGLLSGLCYALYVLLSKKQTASMDPFFFSFLVSIGCAAFFGVYAGIEGTLIIPINIISLGHIAGIAILATRSEE
ncbi:MAG: DMT family transporter, partial [Alphaproteobacteria bacterium]|nr:DMT family transporter [Alphaproteobacteria bacterium]